MHEPEMIECRRRIALAASLYTLMNHNPDFKAVIMQGFLNDAVLQYSLNINRDKSGTIPFLRAAATFKNYLDTVIREGEQAQADLINYQEFQQDGR
jgi:hypothetical protein